jgi:hypothetical protein
VHPVLKFHGVFFLFPAEKTEVSTDFASVTRDPSLLLSELRQILFETHEQIFGSVPCEKKARTKRPTLLEVSHAGEWYST